MTIGVYYDTLMGKGGAERMVVELANALNADIITSGYTPESLIIKPKYPVHDLGNFSVKLFKPLGYLFEAPFRFYFKRSKYEYDVSIYIGFTSVYGIKKNRNSVWYCLTPNRMIYGIGKLDNQSILKKFYLFIYRIMFSAWDKKSVNKMGKIVSQTNIVRKKGYGIVINLIPK